MTYEKMLELTEADLATQNITTGARNKLLQSVGKLKLRANLVLISEYSLFVPNTRQYNLSHSYHTLSQTLFHVRGFLSTPIGPSNPPPAGGGGGNGANALVLAIDLNNNNANNIDGGGLVGAERVEVELLRAWKMLAATNDRLPEIITRLLGHGKHI